jgi:Homeodomain-like domain
VHPLTKLGPRHHAAIRMKLAGASGRAIAAALGVERRTVWLWFSDPLVKHELARQLARLNRRFADLEAAAAVQSCSLPRQQPSGMSGRHAEISGLGGEVAARLVVATVSSVRSRGEP